MTAHITSLVRWEPPLPTHRTGSRENDRAAHRDNHGHRFEQITVTYGPTWPQKSNSFMIRFPITPSAVRTLVIPVHLTFPEATHADTLKGSSALFDSVGWVCDSRST